MSVRARSWTATAFAGLLLTTLTSPAAVSGQAGQKPAPKAGQDATPAAGVAPAKQRSESLADGPYLMRSADGSAWIARWTIGDRDVLAVTEQQLPLSPDAKPAIGTSRPPDLRDCFPPRCTSHRAGAARSAAIDATSLSDDGSSVEVDIAAVGRVPSFVVPLRPLDPVAENGAPLPPDTPLFVVADTHGEYEILVQLLQKHGVIDQELRWSFRRGRLALLGDVFDRGPNHTEIFWLIYKLEAEAARAGGGVHLLLGNHEAIVMLGDEGDQHPRYQRIARALKVKAHAALWGKDTFLGRWLRTKASVMKIGDYLCLHGGMSRAAIDRKLTVAKMNQTVRDALNQTTALPGPWVLRSMLDPVYLNESPQATEADKEMARFVMGAGGPLWYRGYFPEEPGFVLANDDDVTRICEYYGVRAMLVGHTIVKTIKPLYDGKVIAVQVSMTRNDAGQPVAEGLLIRNGTLRRALIDGSTEPLSAPGSQP